MTSRPTLASGPFITPTPAGALHVVTTEADGPIEHLIRAVLRSDSPVQLTDDDVTAWTGVRSRAEAIQVVADAQTTGWIEGRAEPPQIPDAPLGEVLPVLLAPLSEVGHAALVDDQGFGLASVGFSSDDETALSAMSAEIARFQQRRGTAGLLGHAAEGWAVVDRHGAGAINFYPLAAGTQHFVLIVGGMPRLNQPSFVTLIWALSMRYDATSDTTRTAATPATTTTGGRTHA
jgi:hypothetical protein